MAVRTMNKVDVDLRAVPLRHPAGFSSSSGNKRVRNGVGGGGGGGGGGEEELDRLTKEAMAKCGCKRCITREMNNPTKSLNSVSKIDRQVLLIERCAQQTANQYRCTE